MFRWILRWSSSGENPLVESKCWTNMYCSWLLTETNTKDYENQWDYDCASPRKVLITELINVFFFCRICNLSWEPISNFLSVNLVLGKKWWGWWCFVDEERGSWASQVQTCQVSLTMEMPSTHIFNILNPPGPGLAAESVNPVHSILVVLWDKCFLKMK